jgi:hypothetical protein
VISTLISSDQISEIATENRTFGALAALGLGVSSAMPDNNTPSAASANYTLSMNGLRPSHNIWIIDGGEADDRGGGGAMDLMPSQDAIAEFTVMSSNYPPDYGIFRSRAAPRTSTASSSNSIATRLMTRTATSTSYPPR